MVVYPAMVSEPHNNKNRYKIVQVRIINKLVGRKHQTQIKCSRIVHMHLCLKLEIVDKYKR